MISLYLVLCLAITAFADSPSDNMLGGSFYHEGGNHEEADHSHDEEAIVDSAGERVLLKDLFRDYNKLARPVKKHTTPVPVDVGINPIRINFMNEVSQVFSMESFLVVKWADEYLTWNPAAYNNITILRIYPSEVWKPDIALYTASSDVSYFPKIQPKILIYNNGTLLWVPPFTINSRCPTTLTNHDNSSNHLVECNIRMGSWTLSNNEIDLHLYKNKVDMIDFVDNNREWKFHKVVYGRESKHYDCCPEEYSHVDFNVTIERRDAHSHSHSENDDHETHHT